MVELVPFTGYKESSASPCPKCGSIVELLEWDSSDGAYTDYKAACTNKECHYKYWYEGADS